MPIRIQRKRTKGWRIPHNTVCVDRSTKWGNPFTIPEIVDNAQDAVYNYEAWLKGLCIPIRDRRTPIIANLDEWTRNDYLAEIRAELKGRNLACWCALSQPCHADVLLRIANAVP